MKVRSLRILAAVAMVAIAASLGGAERSHASELANVVQTAQTRSGQVYLLRGLMNVFSLGMDTLGHKLRAQGLSVNVYNHSSWPSLAQSIAAQHNAGRGADPIIIVGHSLGADAAIMLAERLGGMGVPVSIVFTFDPVSHRPAPANVRRFVNFYQSNNGWGHPVAPGPNFRGQLVNQDLRERRDIGHTSIDKAATLHDAVVSEVLKVTQPVRRSRATS